MKRDDIVALVVFVVIFATLFPFLGFWYTLFSYPEIIGWGLVYLLIRDVWWMRNHNGRHYSWDHQ